MNWKYDFSVAQLLRLLRESESKSTADFFRSLRCSAPGCVLKSFNTYQRARESDRRLLNMYEVLQTASKVILKIEKEKAEQKSQAESETQTLGDIAELPSQRGIEMDTFKTRLEKLESELTIPKLLYLWLNDLQSFDSPNQYFVAAMFDETRASPENHLLQHARARKAENHGPPDATLDDEIAHALQKVLFVKTLVLAANSEVDKLLAENCNRVNSLYQIVQILEFFLNSDRWCEFQQHLSATTPTTSETGGDNDEVHTAGNFRDSGRNLNCFTTRLHDGICDVMTNLRAVEIAIDFLSRRFCQNVQILFPSVARALAEVRDSGRVCNEVVMSIDPTDADVERLEKIAQEKSSVLTRNLIDFSRSVVALRFNQKTRTRAALKIHLSNPDA